MSSRRLLASPLAIVAAVAVTLLLRSFNAPLGQAPVVMTIKTGEWSYEPKEVSVASSSAVSLTLEHVGSASIPHDIVFEFADGQSVASKRITGGQQDALAFTTPAQAGEYVFYCSVGNHRSRGMEGTLVVTASGSPKPSPVMTDVETPTATATTTPAPPPTASSTPKPRSAFMPLVHRKPTATPPPTPMPSNTPVLPTETQALPPPVPSTAEPTWPLDRTRIPPPETTRSPRPTSRPRTPPPPTVSPLQQVLPPVLQEAMRGHIFRRQEQLQRAARMRVLLAVPTTHQYRGLHPRRGEQAVTVRADPA